MGNETLNKYFQTAQTQELMRSEIRFSNYNPRKLTKEGKDQIKRSIKRYGVVGGIVINANTNNTIVGGHQKVSILDELNKYNEETKENDYCLKVEVVSLDLKTEKELNITLNNPNVSGEWDYDKLREMIPDIDYKDAGLTEQDLSMIGVDFLFQTEEENNITDELSDLMQEVNDQHQSELQQKQVEKEAQRAMEEQAEREAKIQHMKDVKNIVKENAIGKANNNEAYVMISFDTWEAKANFCRDFGYDEMTKFIKGEEFTDRLDIGE